MTTLTDLHVPTASVPALAGYELESLDAWWRACNYLTVGQIYLQSNPLLHRPLTVADIKPRLLGHWGTSPGIAFVHAHLARLVRHTAQEVLLLTGPGHGGAALVAASWLDGTYSERFPDVSRDAHGLAVLTRQFSSPGGIPSHASATTPGSIHEGGELGYVLMHAFGAVLDNPDLLAVAIVGDGEAETAPLEGSWKGISFLDPVHDGAVLPVLHLNGAKIAGPTVLARKPPAEVRSLLEGHGYEVLEVEGDDLPGMHERFAEVLATAWARIRSIQDSARTDGRPAARPRWPMIVLRSPKGWTGPHEVDGVRIEGTWRSHQVPLHEVRENPAHLRLLEEWLASYRPAQLFEQDGRPTALVDHHCRAASPPISASRHTNSGVGAELRLRAPADHALDVARPGRVVAESTRALGRMLADCYRDNPTTFRLFCPDETASNRLGDVLEVTDRATAERVEPGDVGLSHGGRLMEVLSEHSCHGWLEGYTLTGRHGLFATYEAFAMVSASQTVQHAKWLVEAADVPWRHDVPSLNLLLTSTAWRNDHNGFSHQGPGLIQNVLTMQGRVGRVYLPPDANTLLAVSHHVLRSRSTVNVVVIDKQPQLQWLDLPAAVEHVRRGAGRWEFAGNDAGREPDVVLACAGDIVTTETVAAAERLRAEVPDLVVRVVNVVDLMALAVPERHPHALDELAFRELFGVDVPVVFAFHGFPSAIHDLVHGRPGADRFHVRGFTDHGTTTTPHDMLVRNRVSRQHLVLAALERARRTPDGAAALRDSILEELTAHTAFIHRHLEDPPEIAGWRLGS